MLSYNVVDDDNDPQLSISSLPSGGVALQHYDLPRPLKGINSNILAKEDVGKWNGNRVHV